MEIFDRSLCRNDTFSPFYRPPLQGNFCASQSAAVTKVKGGLRSFCIRFVSELLQRERPKLLYCLLPPPSICEGGGGRRFFKGEACSKKSLQKNQKKRRRKT